MLFAVEVGEEVILAVNEVAVPAQLTIELGVNEPFNNGWLGKGWELMVALEIELVQPLAFLTVTE